MFSSWFRFYTLIPDFFSKVEMRRMAMKATMPACNGRGYQKYNPDSAGTQRDECLVGDSCRQVLVDGDKDIEVVQE